MNQTEMFRLEELPSELETEQWPGVFENGFGAPEFEDEFRRAGGVVRRGGRASGRGSGRVRAPIGARRPQPPKPRPRPPRPRWPTPGWPPAGSYYPLPTVPLVEPVGSGFAAGSSEEQLRCVRQCLGQGADGDAVNAPPESPQPEPAGGAAPTPEEFSGPADGEIHEFEVLALGPAARVPAQWEDEFRLATAPTADVSGDCRIIDLTAQSDRSVPKGTRDPRSVYALVLHQMACCFRRRDPLRSYLRIKAHFAILPEGQILQLHPVSALIWASHGFNSCSVAVEFAGNFPSTRGRWWKGEKYGRNQVTPAQIEAGRCLVRHLIRTMGLRVVVAHRQSSNMRGNDPGPDIWYHVGQWAVDTLGLSDGGPGFKIGTGSPIPDEWRTWGSRGATAPELEFGAAEGEHEDELWRGAPEGEVGLEVSLPAAIADPRSAGPGIYTLYRGGQRLYAGRSNHLRRRLQQHLWCLTHLGVGAADYSVKLTPMRGASAAQLQRVEAAVIGRYGLQAQGGALSNVKARELEQELFEGPPGAGY